MPKTLRPKNKDKCHGCELCVLEAQRQLQKVGLEGSLIRIFRDKNKETGKLEYSIEVDPRIDQLDEEKIESICPRQVFEIVIETD